MSQAHRFQPEEVMAFLDGEITGERALELADHIEQCKECSSLTDDFCSVSQQLGLWKVEPADLVQPEMSGEFTGDVEEQVLASREQRAPGVALASSPSSSGVVLRASMRRPWVWALASGLVVALVVSTPWRMFVPSKSSHGVTETKLEQAISQEPESLYSDALRKATVDGAGVKDNSANARIEDLPVNGRNYIGHALTKSQMSRDSSPSIGPAPNSGLNIDRAPMIEKTVSLAMVVKQMEAARNALEEIAKQHQGYFGELSTEGQSPAGRILTASLRVPVGELESALGQLRGLGQMTEEKQSGEEVSRQYVDLKARLENARHTEKRLTELLTRRADKLKDVLDVERELAGTREEIERMQAEQRNMENLVHYASVHLQLREEYKPTLNLAPPAAGKRMRNALVDGYHNALEMALNLLLFILEDGPTIFFFLILLFTLFTPARWCWRKLRGIPQPQSLAGAL